MMTSTSKEQIVSLFRIIPKERIELDEKTLRWNYSQNTLNTTSRSVLASIIVLNTEELSAVVNIANRNSICVYPISTGHNWGYGCATPTADNCIIIDLSQMNKIVDFDEESGVVTLEPGVTQAKLSAFLEENNYDYMVPTTGAGPSCSIIGNMLERGYGLAPTSDHSHTLNATEAVLADGSIYNGSIPNDLKQVNSRYRWSVGPHLSALFIQSNLAIIARASIRLSYRPDKICLVTLAIEKSEIPNSLTKQLSKLQQVVGTDHISPITIMHSERFDKFSGENDEKPSWLERALKKKIFKNHWIVFFTIYGNKSILKAVKKTVKDHLKPYRCWFLSQANQRRVSKIIPKVNYLGSDTIRQFSFFSNTAISAFSGIPTDRGLSFVYSNSKFPLENSNLNPNHDQCGIIWLSPILPIDDINEYSEFVYALLKSHSRNPYISFTTLTPGLALASIPILYKRGNSADHEQASKCYKKLLEESILMGYHPYRLSILSMPDQLPLINKKHWESVRKIKESLDPNNTISPGRYCLID